MEIKIQKKSLKVLCLGFFCGSLIFISVLFGFKLWYNVLANPSDPETPPLTSPQTPPETPPLTPPGIVLVAPQMQFGSGTYHSSVIEYLLIDPNASRTFYTLDGSEPNESSTEYGGLIIIDFVEGTAVKLKTASYNNGVRSNISEADYYFDNNTPVVISPGDIGTQISNGGFTSDNGQPDQTQKITVNVDTTISLSGANGDTQILISKGTEITKTDNSYFNANLLSSELIDPSLLTVISSFNSLTALQWGIPNIGLQFSSPVLIYIYLGPNYEGQNLSVIRSTSENGPWTNDGIVSPSTCIVTGGYCNFQATKASYYTVGNYIEQNNNSNNQNNSNNSVSNNNYSCNDQKPSSSPNLFQINVNEKSAKLFFTPISNTNKYYISYSTKPNAEEHGTQVTLYQEGGVQNVTINLLKPNTVYYFKVRGQNGCTPGEWSNILSIKTNQKGKTKNNSFYSYKNSKLTSSLISNIKSTLTRKKETKKIELPDSDLIPTPTTIIQTTTKTESSQSNNKTNHRRICLFKWCWNLPF